MTFLLASSVWWDGRFLAGSALRLSGGLATPVPVGSIPQGARRRVFPGTLLPGLRDAHVHSGLVDLGVLRAGGIGAVWDLGSVPERVAELAGRAGGAKLPRIRYAGPFLTAPGGYPSDRGWAAVGSWRAVQSAGDAVDAVGEARAAGATLIKVTAHAGGPRLPLSTLTVIVEAAHNAGLPVVVHAEGAGTVVEAYESGADILAHTPWTEPLDPGLVRACAQRMRWISTLDIHGWGVPTPEQNTAIGNLRRFLEYGGSVRYGTDLGNGPLPPSVNPREIRALQSAGLTPDEILTTMTDDGVTWIPGGLDVEPTRFADVLATARVLDDDVRPRPGAGEPS
ncbi:amidohydrolase [Actinoplanes sp. TBRC 11911]|uniref:amidohydrolase family protein n=1 Tax=Actinoplanes sp. TBRC 11911 TaxID=2729386 RepID=UPI00145FC676|nr:amidohydrolase [Actinoplanes sp. TBRC 11911]NMO53146.1 amidohydrolase [Actinoplanes sp. TBRC 11911]